MNILILIFYLIKLTISINHHFSNPLQRFVYDDRTNTIILASVNHIYSLNANDLSILSDIDLSPTKTDHQCLLTNKTILSKNIYYFSTSSYLTPTINQTYNQLLLLINNSILICSTSNRGRSCQLRSLENLNLIKNSSQRLVSSSPFYPSIGFINKNNQILYLSNTYDTECDPFYEIPTISGRHLNEENFLSIINLNSGQSALQQSTYTLRLLNIRLIKEFFLYYLYGFEYKQFSYFLTIQQSDIYKYKLQTKILRFCQRLNQTIIKSYIEIPLTCGDNYHYLITAKFSEENKTLYGLFRNTTSANLSSTSHAICAYSIDQIQQGFYQTIKRCLVDGKGHRGLGFISPDTHCISSKNLNEINEDYCPDENESFFQYPIGSHRSIEQTQPIIQLNDRVNFTAIEIQSNENDMMIFIGDDNGTLHTFRTSNINEISKQKFQSKIIIDLKLIHPRSISKNSELIILTDNQIIKQNLNICEQYLTCNECSNIPLCSWSSKENKCTYGNKKMNMCINIEQVIPEIISSTTELQISFNNPLGNNLDEYMCQFNINDREFYRTKGIFQNNTIKCLSASLNNMILPIYDIILSIYHIKTNLTFGYYNLKFLNCSNFHSCSSCTSYSNICQWNHEKLNCISSQENKTRELFIKNSNQCPMMYLQKSLNYLSSNIDHTFKIHIEQCDQSMIINSCQLYDQHKRFIIKTFNPILINEKNICLLKCLFKKLNFQQMIFYRLLNLHLSIEYSNKTTFVIPNTQISLYHCEHLALNCSSCLQLNPSYGCIWCNNQCSFKNQSIKCLNNNQECLTPIIEKIQPLILPTNGGTIVTIKGNNFDLFQLSIYIGNVPCQLIEEESSNNKIVCQSGDAKSIYHTGSVYLKFGSYGPQIYSKQIISYVKPKLNSIEPLFGIQNGGTILTIHGENFTIGNSHIIVLIGNRLCQLLSISIGKIECKTRLFPFSMLNKTQSIKILFDRQTKLIYKESFMIIPNPILHLSNKYQSFISGGHQLIIPGENFDKIQNIRLELQDFTSISPFFRNDTHLIFITPSSQQKQQIDIIIHLDNFNKTSSLIYINDPVIYELEPLFQSYTNQLIIQGMNLTSIKHTKHDIFVHIGCDLCSILHLQSDQIICQPPENRPEKYSKSKHLCYSSEHPSIIVSIDNIHSHIGFMIYPKKVIVLGIITGCLLTLVFITLVILIIICLKIRYKQRKNLEEYFYPTKIIPHEIEIEKEKSCLIPIRSYINYLQMCYSSNDLFSNTIQYNIKQELIDQFKYLINNNEFFDYLIQYSIKINNRKILNHLILTQRYNFKKLFQYNHDWIYWNICLFTSYDSFLINHLHTLFSQLYSQLKLKISSGPIDAIEPTISYYSLNQNTILHDQSIGFKTILLIIHIDKNNISLNLPCLTCDTITQIKEKILYELNLLNEISIDECKLYLLTNPSCSSSSSSTASSSVPLIRKSMLTQICLNHTMKYSTTTINNDLYHETNMLLLNDIDNTNEQINNFLKLNTLQHYGILTDGYELKLILSNNKSSNYYYSLSKFNYLTLSVKTKINPYEYIHLLNHTYEEIENINPYETYRLFQTKSMIHSILINLIEYLFQNLIHQDLYLNELLKEYSKIYHIFYAHFIPFIFQNIHCLFNIPNDQCLQNSFYIIGNIFQIGCYQQHQCLLCTELLNNKNIQNCTILFNDEIQRVKLYYSNLETYLKNKNLSSEYSSTNIGIERKFELDNSIFIDLIEYSYEHGNEIIEYLKNQSSDDNILSGFVNLIQMYRFTERT